MKILLTLLLFGAVFLAACEAGTVPVDEPVSQISSFDECAAAGNPVMESYPRQCQAFGEIFVEETDTELQPRPCTREYVPVCGEVEVQCVTAPCDPVKATFANNCLAEKAGASNIVPGECQDDVNLEDACLSFDGDWVEEHDECEGMSQTMCENLGGRFDECASACRHVPTAEICTKQCVVVCSFA